MISELRLAGRTLARSRGFTIAAVGVLALGIGAAATVFSVVDAILIRPLPYPAPDRLAVIYATQPARGVRRGGASFPDLNDWREQLSAFDGILAYLVSNVSLSGSGEAERVSAALVSEDFFRVMGLQPSLGRAFRGDEWKPGGPKVAIAVSLALLVGALLLTRSFARMERADPGFDANGVLTLRISLPESRYPSDSSIARFHEQLHAGLRVLPGVASSASVLTPPLGDVNTFTAITIEGQLAPPGQADSREEWITVVGVARDIKQFGVRGGTAEGIYLPFTQSPPRTATIALRVVGEPTSLATSARRIIHALDPELAVFGVESLPQILTRAIWQPRLQAVLVGTFATIALVLAAVGVYSVVSYAVAQRTREIGVRMALGAQRSAVLRLVLGQGVRLTLAGVALGLIGSLAAAKLLAGLLFGVSARDPVTFAAVPILLVLVAMVACYLPARRAASVDPVVALRADQ